MHCSQWASTLAATFVVLAAAVHASSGDRLHEFRNCLDICYAANCDSEDPTPIPLHRRLLLWNCPSECDYTCQHIITRHLLSDSTAHPDTSSSHTVHQFHGKWPFHRFLGMQEPFSVLFSGLNYLAHARGIAAVRKHIPRAYPLRVYYVMFGLVGLMSWTASMVFHTRDFVFTERWDYFAAGANVMYGLYYTPIRIFRLDDPTGQKPAKRSFLRLWTLLCLALYAAHVAYLSLWTWDYTYNMGANIAVGITTNVLWTWFSLSRYSRSGRFWQAWPGLIVAWVILAMSLEILDFVPFGLMIDAHSLWHLGTVGPTVWWYNFLVRDALEDMETQKLKA